MPPKKATSEQYKTLVNLVKDCECIKYGKGTPDQKKEAWESISITLNAIGGIEKTAEGWKKAYAEMKSHIKAKIRAGKSLNKIEKICAEISGLFISCTGLSGVPELGGIIEIIVEKVPEGPEITDVILGQEEQPEIQVFEEGPDETRAEGIAQEKPQTATKKIGSKKKSDKSMQLIKKQKTSALQYEMYLELKKIKNQNDKDAYERLCNQLNEEKNCVKRTSANWKKIFSEWESKVKAKARRIHFEQELTGGGIPIIEILTNLEKKLLEVLSKILIYGHPQVVELGFKKKITKVQTYAYKTSITRKGRKNYRKHLRECIAFNQILYENATLIQRSLSAIKNSHRNLNEALVNLANALSEKNI